MLKGYRMCQCYGNSHLFPPVMAITCLSSTVCQHCRPDHYCLCVWIWCHHHSINNKLGIILGSESLPPAQDVHISGIINRTAIWSQQPGECFLCRCRTRMHTIDALSLRYKSFMTFLDQFILTQRAGDLPRRCKQLAPGERCHTIQPLTKQTNLRPNIDSLDKTNKSHTTNLLITWDYLRCRRIVT